MGVRVYKLLSQKDIYLGGGHCSALNTTAMGFSRRKKKTEVADWRKRKQVLTEED